MRDVNRLDNFYNTLKDLHKNYCPDWRFMQLFNNFLSWHFSKYGNDGFYMEENRFIERFNEFINEIVRR